MCFWKLWAEVLVRTQEDEKPLCKSHRRRRVTVCQRACHPLDLGAGPLSAGGCPVPRGVLSSLAAPLHGSQQHLPRCDNQKSPGALGWDRPSPVENNSQRPDGALTPLHRKHPQWGWALRGAQESGAAWFRVPRELAGRFCAPSDRCALQLQTVGLPQTAAATGSPLASKH